MHLICGETLQSDVLKYVRCGNFSGKKIYEATFAVNATSLFLGGMKILKGCRIVTYLTSYCNAHWDVHENQFYDDISPNCDIVLSSLVDASTYMCHNV